MEMIGDVSLLPPKYRRLFVRNGLDGTEKYGPERLRYNDRYHLAMFCLVNGLDPDRIHEFMASHGAYQGKEERRGQVDSQFRSLISTSKQHSAYSVHDRSYVFLDGEPDHQTNLRRGTTAIACTYKTDEVTGRRTHYREHVIVGRAMGSYKPPEWRPYTNRC